MPKVLFLPGSLRAASSSRALMRALADRIADRATCDTADPGALPLYNADLGEVAEVEALKAQIAAADLLVFVTPEYNYSVPGLLKNAIDWASRPAYESVFVGKPCVIVTTSGGATGGIRAQAHLKYILNGMLARVVPAKEIVVPFANRKVEDGTFTDTDILDFAQSILTDALSDLG